jgi:protease-4
VAMSAEEIIDRRRLRTSMRWWRLAAFVLLAIALIASLSAGGAFEGMTRKGSDHIARVRIDGVISSDRKMVELLESLKKKNQVKAVILEISTPGGSTAGGEALYEAVRDLAAKKPVVASVDTLAASAGYMIACATDQIVARRSSIVGSIGVLFQYGDVAGLLDKLGVHVDAIKSSPLKAEPSPFKPASEEAKAMVSRVVGDSYDWFVNLVAERRKMPIDKTRALADGSIYTGTQGLANGLVDRIGGEETARKWLVDERGISDDLKIVEWKSQAENPYGIDATMATLLKIAGIDAQLVQESGLNRLIERTLFLDGLRSQMQERLFFSGDRNNDKVRTGPVDCREESAPLPAGCGKHRQRHFRRDHAGALPRQPRGTARFRRVFGEEPAGAHRAQSAHRRQGRGRREMGAVLQDRQGTARKTERRLRREIFPGDTA